MYTILKVGYQLQYMNIPYMEVTFHDETLKYFYVCKVFVNIWLRCILMFVVIYKITVGRLFRY